MIAAPCSSPLQNRFLAVLPRIVAHARVVLRNEPPYQQEELFQEITAVCWLWFTRLVRRGKDPTTFVSDLATYCVRYVRCGRRMTGTESTGETLSRWSQCRHRFQVHSLNETDARGDQSWQESLCDNTQAPVADQAAFRIDFPRWLRGQCRRNKRIIRDMMRGERTKLLAGKYRLSPGRISQLRQELHASWQTFHGE